jgi:hypothetical protein
LRLKIRRTGHVIGRITKLCMATSLGYHNVASRVANLDVLLVESNVYW